MSLRSFSALLLALVLIVSLPPAAHAGNEYRLQVGASVSFTNASNGDVTLTLSTTGIGSELEAATYDTQGQYTTCYGCQQGRFTPSGKVIIIKNTRVIFTNSGTSDLTFGGTGSLQISPSSHPALATVTVKPGTNLRFVNDNFSDFYLRVDFGFKASLDYAFYDDQGHYATCYGCWHGVATVSGSWSIPRRVQVVLSNSSAGDVTLSGPYELFHPEVYAKAALKRKVLELGTSVVVTNETQSSYYIRAEIGLKGQLDYAFYDGQGQYLSCYACKHGQMKSSDRIEVRAMSQVSLTNAGTSGITLLGPEELFAVDESQVPAVGTTAIRPAASILLTNDSQAPYLVYLQLPFGGKLDYAYYDDQGRYNSGYSYRHGRLTQAATLEIPVRGQLILTNAGQGEASVIAPYRVFRGAQVASSALSYTDVTPGGKLSIPNSTGVETYVSISVPMGGKFGFTYYDAQGKQDNGYGLGAGQQTQSQLQWIPNGRKLEITNQGQGTISVAAPQMVYPGGNLVAGSPITLETPAMSKTKTPGEKTSVGSPKGSGIGVRITDISSTTATLEWSADKPVRAVVSLSDRTDPIVDGEVADAKSVQLTDLTPGETYVVEVWLGEDGNEVGFILVFETKSE